MIVRRIIKLSALAMGLLAASVFTLFSASVYTFHVLTAETKIADLRFERLGEKHFLAILQTGDGCDERVLEIYGDQWRVDAVFLKWKYWASLLGLDAQYRLDRLEGRYTSASEQNVMPKLAHDLRPSTTVDVVGISNALGPLNFLTDASYGSSTYQDIDTSSVHHVYRTQTGLITRSEPLPPAATRPAGLAVEVTRGCGARPGLWQRFARWTDGALAALL